MGTDLDTGMNAGVDADMGADVNVGVDADMGAGVDVGVDASMDTDVYVNMNAGKNTGKNTGKNAGMNTGMNADANTDMSADIRAYLKKYIKPGRKYAVMGVGSTLRSDDGAGMYFIEHLSSLIQRDDVLLIAGSTAPENFTGVIKNFAPATLFIVDAAHMGLLPGETRVIPACNIEGVSFSTHMLPLPVMLKYLEMEAGCDVVFIGIQPVTTEQGLNMNDEVKKGAEYLSETFYNAIVQYLADGEDIDDSDIL